MGFSNGIQNGAADHDAPHDDEPESDPFAGLAIVGPVPTERKVRDWALVLQSIPLWHVTRRTMSGGWILVVREEDAGRARASIERYEEENRDWPPPQVKERLPYAPSLAAPILFAALVAFYWITGPAIKNSMWFQHGVAISNEVVGRAPWQAVTALTLHADSMHVLGNAISGTIFATFVFRRFGPGGGALAILASGAAGNFANAVYHHFTRSGDHGSLGASTAVFGAVGLLAATQIIVDRTAEKRERSVWRDVVAPLVGGLALLGALGASPDADLGAHAFGFIAGLAIGLVAAWRLRKTSALPPREWIQIALGSLGGLAIVSSWLLAFRR